MQFKQHIQYIAKKGAEFALAIARIGKSIWGAQFQQLRHLFTAVAAPRMDYRASVWHRPTSYEQTTPPTQLTKLISAQQTAMKAILGGFRTTSTPALEIESTLAPTHLRLQSKILRSFTRLQALPSNHPSTAYVERAIRSQSTTSLTNLEYIARTFPEYAKPVEKIQPFIRPP